MSRILVAEDEPLVRMILVEALQDAGHQVCEVSSAEEAITHLRHRAAETDVLVTDNRMAIDGMTGAELLTEVRQLYPHIARIMVSGTPPGNAAEFSQAYLTKPVDFGRLQAAISAHAPQPS